MGADSEMNLTQKFPKSSWAFSQTVFGEFCKTEMISAVYMEPTQISGRLQINLFRILEDV